MGRSSGLWKSGGFAVLFERVIAGLGARETTLGEKLGLCRTASRCSSWLWSSRGERGPCRAKALDEVASLRGGVDPDQCEEAGPSLRAFDPDMSGVRVS
jgi:hypothetical protein